MRWPVLRMGCRPRAIQDWFYTCSRVGIACLATVARFAREEIAPKVREMDDSMTMDSDVIQGLFDQGVRRGAVAVVAVVTTGTTFAGTTALLLTRRRCGERGRLPRRS